MKLGMDIMPPDAISTAYFTNNNNNNGVRSLGQ
jgi:hypothetical protein